MRNPVLFLSLAALLSLVSCEQKVDQAEIERRVQERLAAEHQAEKEKPLADRERQLSERETAFNARETAQIQPPQAPTPEPATPAPKTPKQRSEREISTLQLES